MLGQFAHDGGDRPDEHSGIPPEITLLEEGLGQGGIGFFPEAFHLVNGGLAVGDAAALLDVAEAGTGPRRLDPDGQQCTGVGGRTRAGQQIAAEGCRILDQVVGGQHGHDRVRVAPQDETDTEGNRRCGIALGGLGDNVLRGQTGTSGADGRLLLAVGQDKDPFGRNGRAETGDGFLQHGVVGKKFEQLLRTHAAAVGPEPLAATAGENEGIKVVGHGRMRRFCRAGCNPRPKNSAGCSCQKPASGVRDVGNGKHSRQAFAQSFGHLLGRRG